MTVDVSRTHEKQSKKQSIICTLHGLETILSMYFMNYFSGMRIQQVLLYTYRTQKWRQYKEKSNEYSNGR